MTSTEKKAGKLKLDSKFSVTWTGSSAKIAWGQVKDADTVEVYAAYCSTGAMKLVKTLKGAASSWTLSKLNGKKLDQTANIKVMVKVYRTVNGKKTLIAKSITAHVVGPKSAEYTNPKKITLKKSSFTLQAGKTAQIQATVVLQDKTKQPLGDSHAPELRYASSNENVAKVSEDGFITAVSSGECTVYVYARNGLAKTVKVKVK